MSAQDADARLSKGLADAWLDGIEHTHEFEASTDAVPSGLTRDEIAASSHELMQILAVHALASAALVFILQSDSSEAAMRAQSELIAFFQQYDDAERMLDSDQPIQDAFRLSMRSVHRPQSALRENLCFLQQEIAERLQRARMLRSAVRPGAPVSSRASFENYSDESQTDSNREVAALDAASQEFFRRIGLVKDLASSPAAVHLYIVAFCAVFARGAYRQKTPAERIEYFRSQIATLAIGAPAYIMYISFQWQMHTRELGLFPSRAVDEMEATRATPGQYWWIGTFVGNLLKGVFRFGNELTIDAYTSAILFAGLLVYLGLWKAVHVYTNPGSYAVAIQRTQLEINDLRERRQQIYRTMPSNMTQALAQLRIDLDEEVEKHKAYTRSQELENTRNGNSDRQMMAWTWESVTPRLFGVFGGVRRPQNAVVRFEPALSSQQSQQSQDLAARQQRELDRGQAQVEEFDDDEDRDMFQRFQRSIMP
jgi:hypothetical protein